VTYFYLLLSLLAVDLLAAMSPGPNFLLVIQTSVKRTRRHAAAVVLGFVSANLVWCAAVVFGLSTLFRLAPWLYGFLKVAGGAYLIYLGITLWRSESVTTDLGASPDGTVVTAYARGLLTNLSNPKSVVYFGSIFALFMKPGTPGLVQLVAVVIVLLDTALWYGAVALMFSSSTVRQVYRRMQKPLNRFTALVMIGFGVRLMLVREHNP
jgi:threonine efflux protein